MCGYGVRPSALAAPFPEMNSEHMPSQKEEERSNPSAISSVEMDQIAQIHLSNTSTVFHTQ